MPLYLKSAPSKSFTDSAQSDVAERVSAIIDDIRGNGDAAVRKYSEQFDKWSPDAFRLDDARVAEIMATLDQQVIDDIVFVQEQVRRFAQAQRDSLIDIEVETLPGRVPRPEARPGAGRGRLHPRRQVPADRLGAHDDHHREGRRRAARRRVHAADPRRDPRGDRRGHEARRRGRDLRPRRRAGGDRDGRRHRDDRIRSTSSPARATRTWPRPSASSSARSASICSPDPPRSSSSPTTTPTRSSPRSTCSRRPSTVRSRRRCSSPPLASWASR